MTKRELRIQRLEDGIEDGGAYTSQELVAIAYDKDVADATLSDQAYISKLRGNGAIDLQTMPDPNRHGNAKLYYRGEQPDIAVLDEQEDAAQDDPKEQGSDTAECQYCGEEYKQRGVRRHERSCDENPDVETAWTPSRVETVMQGQGWMSTEEIAHGVLDKETVSYNDRDRFHDLLSRKPDLEARITSRLDPDDNRRNQYRLIEDTAASKDNTESENTCGCPTNVAGEIQHEGDCPQGAEQELEEMQDLYEDDEPDEPELADPDPEPEPATTDTGDEDAEELIEEMGPCNIGKIMVEGEFDRYVCQECQRTFHEESAADAHADDANHPTFKAFDQVLDEEKQPAGFVGGGTAR